MIRADNLIYIHNKSTWQNKSIHCTATLTALDFRYGILAGISLNNILIWNVETQSQIVIPTLIRMSDILISGCQIKDYIFIIQRVLLSPLWRLGFLVAI